MGYNKSRAESIRDGIEQLQAELVSSPEKVDQITRLFIHETPLLCEEINGCIDLGKWQEAAVLVHKVKVRFGYVGLENIANDLSLWEQELAVLPEEGKHKKKIIDVKQITLEVVDELRKVSAARSEQAKKRETLPLKGRHVLIAEDDDVNAMVFELFIQETGASTMIATDGIQAINLVKEKKPDMIFMDVHMPFFNGLEAIRELRKLHCDCPIVSLSASSRLNERQNSLDAGANEFLMKPANREAINKVLFKYLG